MPEAIGASMAVMMLAFVPAILLGLAYPYLALRFRDSKAERPDPELGIKAGYYFLYSLALMMVVLGLSVCMIQLMQGTFGKGAKQRVGVDDGPFAQPRVVAQEKKDEKFSSPVMRIGLAVTVSGSFFSVLLLLLIKSGTNDAAYPAAKRTFVGARLAVAGIIIMMVITVFMVMMFLPKNAIPDDAGNAIYEVLVAFLIVWLPTFVIHLILMRVYSSQPYYRDGYGHGDRDRDRDRPRRPYDD